MVVPPIMPVDEDPASLTPERILGSALVERLDRLDVVSRKVFAGKLPGERRSKRRGRSVEFSDYRPYAPGDDLRHIDWNVLARLDRLFVKVFAAEEDLSLHVILDASASMHAGRPAKIDAARRLAVALAYVGLVNRNRLIAAIVGAPGRDAVQTLAPLRGRTSVRRALEFFWLCAGPPPDAGPVLAAPVEYAPAMRTLRARRTTPGVVVFISDFLFPAELEGVLNTLTGGRVPIDAHCVRVLHQSEEDPSAEALLGGDVRLIDAESGRAVPVTVSPALLRLYRRRAADHTRRLVSLCTARDISCTLLTSEADPARAMLDSLRRRRLIG